MDHVLGAAFFSVLFSLVAYAYWKVWRRKSSGAGPVVPDHWLVEDAARFADIPADELVTIGHFHSTLLAEAYEARLEAEGIESTVLGSILARTARQSGLIQLRVRAEDAERALEALKSGGEE